MRWRWPQPDARLFSVVAVLLLALAPSSTHAYLVTHVCDDSPTSRLALISMVILGKAVHRDILYCAAGPNEFLEKHVVPGMAAHGVKSLPLASTDITACSLKTGPELMLDPSPLYGATCLEIREPLVLVHHFTRTRPELIGTARELFRYTSADYLTPGDNMRGRKIKPFVLLEYLSETKAAEACSAWPSVPTTQGLPCEHSLPHIETLVNLDITPPMQIKVYTSDLQKSQAHHEHVTSLQAAGFDVEWVAQTSIYELMQLVNQASHYIAHPLSPEGTLLALQRRLSKRWATFYGTGASYLDVFMPVTQFPWLVLNNVTAMPPNKPYSRYQLNTVTDIHADPAYYTQFHVIVVALPETYIHATKLPYLHADIPATACQACGVGLAFCRPAELSLPATRALFKQGHKVSTTCSYLSVYPWEKAVDNAIALHVPVQYHHYTEYFEHAFCPPNAMCLPSFRRHLCLMKDGSGYTDQPKQAKTLASACQALQQV